jgi:hypothetical protein
VKLGLYWLTAKMRIAYNWVGGWEENIYWLKRLVVVPPARQSKRLLKEVLKGLKGLHDPGIYEKWDNSSNLA